MTTNYNFIENMELRQWFYQGTIFKENLSPDSILQSIEVGLDDYIVRKLHLKIPFPDSNLWKLSIINKCQENLNRNAHKIQPHNHLSRIAYHNLNALKQHFVITLTDKLHHNYSLVCKHLYLHRLHQELFSDSYAAVNENLEDILQRHHLFNTRYNYRCDNRVINTLPYLYAMPKMHRVPPSFRFIAGFIDCRQ
jgi:hypothetical protein